MNIKFVGLQLFYYSSEKELDYCKRVIGSNLNDRNFINGITPNYNNINYNIDVSEFPNISKLLDYIRNTTLYNEEYVNIDADKFFLNEFELLIDIIINLLDSGIYVNIFTSRTEIDTLIRIAIVENKINYEKIYYYFPNDKNELQLLIFNKYGNLDDNPRGLFDIDIRLTEKLIILQSGVKRDERKTK